MPCPARTGRGASTAGPPARSCVRHPARRGRPATRLRATARPCYGRAGWTSRAPRLPLPCGGASGRVMEREGRARGRPGRCRQASGRGAPRARHLPHSPAFPSRPRRGTICSHFIPITTPISSFTCWPTAYAFATHPMAVLSQRCATCPWTGSPSDHAPGATLPPLGLRPWKTGRWSTPGPSAGRCSGSPSEATRTGWPRRARPTRAPGWPP